MPLPRDVDLDRATVVHNHPDDLPPSRPDLINAREKRIDRLVIPTPERVLRIYPETDWLEAREVGELWVAARQLADSDVEREVAEYRATNGSNPSAEWAIAVFDRSFEEHWMRLLRQNGIMIE